ARLVHGICALRWGRFAAAGVCGAGGARRIRRTRGGADRAGSDGGCERVGVVAMNLTDYLEKWGRTIFEAPLASAPDPEEPPELAEIRLAVLDQIREKTYRSGGKKVFPSDLLRVQLRGVEESRCAVFAGKFFRKYLEQEMRNALVNAGCGCPENLRVDVEVAGGL